MKKLTSVLVLAGVGTAGVMFGSGMVKDVQFARAEEQVQASRQQIQHAEDLSTVFREVGKVVEPSVVKIDVTKTVKGISHVLPFDDDQLKRMFPDQDGDGEPDVPKGFHLPDQGDMVERGTGSGVIMEVDGSTAYILTNNHVAGGAEEMNVTLSDGRLIKSAKLVGNDPKSDLAVVKIQADRLIPAKWGDSTELQKGDWVVAFGAPFDYIGSMTHGIVSALNRSTNPEGGTGILGKFGYENFIQVDAPINPGNSGGPLVNLHGEVIGINTAIASRSGGFQGIGFAIPSQQAKFVYTQLKEKGKVTRGYLGVGIVDVNDPRVAKSVASFGYKGDKGVFVEQIMPDTPSAGKLQNGDVIEKINGKEVATANELRNQIAAMPPNQDVKLTVYRDGKDQEVSIKLAEQPNDMRVARGGRGGRNDEANGGDAADTNAAKKTGMVLGDLTDELIERFGLEKGLKGAIVKEVEPKSPAAREGIQTGDVITEVKPAGKSNVQVSNAKDAQEALAKADLNKGIRLYVVSRDGSRFVVLDNEK
jgi:serine protease Do